MKQHPNKYREVSSCDNVYDFQPAHTVFSFTKCDEKKN